MTSFPIKELARFAKELLRGVDMLFGVEVCVFA